MSKYIDGNNPVDIAKVEEHYASKLEEAEKEAKKYADEVLERIRHFKEKSYAELIEEKTKELNEELQKEKEEYLEDPNEQRFIAIIKGKLKEKLTDEEKKSYKQINEIIESKIKALSSEEKQKIVFEYLDNEYKEINNLLREDLAYSNKKSLLMKDIEMKKILNEIVKNLQDIDDVIEIGISKNQALFELKNCKIVSRLLEGDFLNYNNVIPKEKETRIKVNKAALQTAIERAAIFSISAAEKEKKYPIKIYVSLGSIIISCTSQIGDAKEEVLVETTGKELEIGFNPKYLVDALKVIEDDEVYLDFGSNISPCVIRPLVDDKYTYMVLPVRLKE